MLDKRIVLNNTINKLNKLREQAVLYKQTELVAKIDKTISDYTVHWI